MSAEIVVLAQFRAQRGISTVAGASAPSPQAHAAATQASVPFQFWSGASGARYVHTIYNLFECPPVEPSNYILVKRHTDGHRTVLSIGRLVHAAPTVNLATLRQRSAEVGANEVHVHLLASSGNESQLIEADLRRSLVIA